MDELDFNKRPVSLSTLYALADSQNPPKISGLTVRKYVKEYYARGRIDLRKVGAPIVVISWRKQKNAETTVNEDGQA